MAMGGGVDEDENIHASCNAYVFSECEVPNVCASYASTSAYEKTQQSVIIQAYWVCLVNGRVRHFVL